ncbi:hypothetical protein KTAU_03460 [Thermogemmatispora aurantia]|uniref:Uncharacterized protein n=1 Tax=Thermogemmatispora aurantia TaxID=2045279 RepID=A0A5J4JVQ5_9CHLR|nr:hypothetical protein KTAU_03460 [Thermogemmatispora aurantia]
MADPFALSGLGALRLRCFSLRRPQARIRQGNGSAEVVWVTGLLPRFDGFEPIRCCLSVYLSVRSDRAA